MGSTSSTLSSTACPSFTASAGFWMSGMPSCNIGTKPSMSCPRSTTTPLSMSRSTRPRSSVPTGYVSPIRSHGSSCACFRPSEMRLFSASTLRIRTSTSSPFFTTSDGCWTRLVHDMSEMWIRPSMPGSISTNAPNDVRLRTLPRSRVPTGYFFWQRHPRILLGLFHAERDLLLRLVHFEHDRLDRFADRHELRRMPDVSRPAHLGDVHQAFDTRLELDECAVVRDRDDLALHARSNRILRRDVLPGIGLQLLQAERDALALPVDVEDFHLELLADLHRLGRMRHAAVAHVGDVQQAIHAAQVDEGAEVGDVLDDALAHLVDRQLLHQHVAFRFALGLEQHAAGDDDVAAALVQLDDLELKSL